MSRFLCSVLSSNASVPWFTFRPRMAPPVAVASILITLLWAPVGAFAQGVHLDDWGGSGSGPGEFNGPQGLHVSDGGVVFVADTGNHRIQKFGLDGSFLLEFGSQGSGNGQFESPWDVGEDWDRNVYVADRFNHRIQKLDADGVFLDQWGGQGSGVGQFESPAGVELNPDVNRVYVLDSGNGRVQVFDLDGNYLFQWGSPGSGSSQFNDPEGIFVDWFENVVFVADTGNHRIQVFDGDGNYIDAFGSQGSGDGQFQSPTGVGNACNQEIYVADTGNNRIQRFDLSFDFVEVWAPPGSGPGQVAAPTGVERMQGIIPVGKASFEDLFVSEAGNDRIQVFEGPCCGGGFCFPDGSSATSAGGTLRISPAGNGLTLAEVGATVTVQIVDCCGNGIQGFPFQDIWLADQGTGDINLCQGGSVADTNTDIDGVTTISGVMFGGGFSEDGLFVYVSGMAMDTHPLDIRVNSADINGDLAVALTDVGMFASDIGVSPAPFRSDLKPDGVIDLADVGIFATHIGEVCP